MKKLSFVIPCYNSEHTIAHVVAEIDNCFSKNDRYEYEIVLVNDASPKDNTLGGDPAPCQGESTGNSCEPVQEFRPGQRLDGGLFRGKGRLYRFPG